MALVCLLFVVLREDISYLSLFSYIIVLLHDFFEFLEHFVSFFTHVWVFLLLAEKLELTQFLVVDPVEWLTAAA